MHVLINWRTVFNAWAYYVMQVKFSRLAIGDDDDDDDDGDSTQSPAEA